MSKLLRANLITEQMIGLHFESSEAVLTIGNFFKFNIRWS